MGCPDWFELISAEVDGELDGPELVLLRSHVDGCEACRATSARLTRMRRSMLVAEPVPVPDLSTAVLAHERLSPHATRRLRRRGAAALAGVAAVLAVVVVASGAAERERMPAPTDAALGPPVVRIIEAGDDRFSATAVTVDVGGSVGWLNGSRTEHRLVHQGGGATSETELRPGQTEVVTYEEPGVYDYSCKIHEQMTGRVVVGS